MVVTTLVSVVRRVLVELVMSVEAVVIVAMVVTVVTVVSAWKWLPMVLS